MGRLFIVGAGGHGQVLAELAGLSGRWESVLMLDDRDHQDRSVPDLPIVGSSADLAGLHRDGDSFLIGLGDNARRIELLRSFRRIAEPATIISPQAMLSPSCTIGIGTVVMPGAIVQTGAVVGEGCILNSGCIVEHGVTLADGVHMAPGASIGGESSIGALSWIGIGASIIHGVSIGSDVIVGAGAVVLESLESSGTYAGVPARRVR
ncbi:MAG: acetyltransferase [Planctomycetota bacterium]|nr:acetyltransferase [Planctomycetota bacterium]